jgi:O-succinylbenzoic acid--CoA ligase
MNAQLPFTTEAFVRGASLLDGPRRYTSLVPTQLHRLLSEVESDAFLFSTLRKFDAILVGGQRPNWSEIQKLKSMGINVVTTYGMTETAGGCVYDGSPLPGVEIAIEEGRVRISGPVLAEGLGGSFLSQDLGDIQEGMLEVLGRADRVLNSGGIKVSLDRVEQLLEELSGISEVAAIAVADEQWGERVAVAYSGSPEVEIEKHLMETIGVAARPVRIERMSSLPKLSSGKIDRLTLQRSLTNNI